ncbi:AgmX/PglI C-terminal domain-containing protein [Chondromyces apiculatus]|uniref:VIT domain-containing protein n=1 Tax=Chondromyces apiculatus DSM 436 TaxID=1192034 RepID=A0A017T028_9BACT|nr:AgmX/PglI C-terminal domain-containing protein [Chondromyces apiculatus]EYF02579.1 Hypothetical protein CAP_6786 [Chondromyces apiculatus DSM 436]
MVRTRGVGRYGLGMGILALLAATGAEGCSEGGRPGLATPALDRLGKGAGDFATDQRVSWVWAGRGQDEAGALSAPRGFGSMTARVPGTEAVVSGVRLASHRVNTVVRDGFARTTIEEEFQNDTERVLEGRYVFPLPPDASISRLALYVGDELVEGEIVERPRAARIFKGIVDDTVRPRDPALLEWVSASEFSLKIFPIPAKGRRKVVLAYDQALTVDPRGDGGEVRYVYPLSLGSDRGTAIDDFSITVKVSEGGGLSEVTSAGYAASLRADGESSVVSYAARGFTPTSDFVVRYRKAADAGAQVAAYTPVTGERRVRSKAREDAADATGAARAAAAAAAKTAKTEAAAVDEAGYFALRLRAELPEGVSAPERQRDRAIVIDVSHSQSKETIEEEARLATAIVRSLSPGERFVVLACDSDCASWPEDGLAVAGSAEAGAAEGWLRARTPGGSSDLGGAIAAAARRLPASGAGQVVVLGDGAPSAGELSVQSIAARLGPVLRKQAVELRLLGIGRSVDEVILGGLSQALGGTYERVATGAPLAERGPEVVASLRSPVIRDPQLALPEGMSEVYPRQLPNLRVGQEVVLTGRLAKRDVRAAATGVVPAAHAPHVPHATQGGAQVVLSGTLAGAPYTLEKPVRWAQGGAAQNPLVPRLWARAKITDLERYTDAASGREAMRLAKEHHVMTRGAAMLVLENERMFAEFGIARNGRKEADLEEDPFAAGAPGKAGKALGHGGVGASAEVGAAGAPGGPAQSAGPQSVAPRSKGATGGAASADGFEARGNLWGTLPDTAVGGLGLSGVGEGGGGRGVESKPAAEGEVSTLGHGAGFGSGSGRLGGAHKSPSPRLRMGATTVSGRLPPEVVQRIVRQNFGRFRLCYEQGLRRNPELTGRVTTRFTIKTDGSVGALANGGSDIPDTMVTACVVNAFRGLSFPSPEAGVVVVTYPIMFSPPSSRPILPQGSLSGLNTPDPATPSSWWSPRSHGHHWSSLLPTAAHREPRAGDGGDATSLAALEAAVRREGASREKHASLVRKLLVAGRTEDALAAATRFAQMDPDLDVAQELLAYAGAASGEEAVALTAVDALSEVGARNERWHERAARAFEASGQERRACAHWRTLAELRPQHDASRYESLRCQARLERDLPGSLAEARAVVDPGPKVKALLAQLEAGTVPAFEAAAYGAGQLTVKVNCSGERSACPWVAVVTPVGGVVSAWTPGMSRASGDEVALSGVWDGTFRVLASGGRAGSEAQVEVSALGARRSFTVKRTEAHTVAMTTVSGMNGTGW